jgi:YVTN family beta-propeller protein
MVVLWGHVNDPVPAATARNPSLPPGIDRVVRRALAKEPAQRYPTCRALIADARAALGVTGAEVPRPRRRRVVATPLTALVLAGVATLAGFLVTRGGAPAAATGALVRIDPRSNAAAAPLAVGAGPQAVAADATDVWVSSRREPGLWRFEPASGTLVPVAAVGVPGDLALARGYVYVAAEGPQPFTGNVTSYDAATGARVGERELLACSLTAGGGGVWVAGCPNVQRLRAGDVARILRTVKIPFASPRDTAHDRQELEDMTTGAGSVWALGDAIDPRLWRIDPRSGRILRTYRLGFAPQHVAVGAGAIWVVDQLADQVVRIDPGSGRELARIPVGAVASGIAVGDGSVWAASNVDRTVSRIDPGTNRVVATIHVGEEPRDVAFGAGALWGVGDAT